MGRKKIRLRTYGGLGNQLFQYFYARCLMHYEGYLELSCFHDSNYAHGFKLDSIFSNLNTMNHSDRFISSLRIPRIFALLRVSNTYKFTLENKIFLDGYFQDLFFYKNFGKEILATNINLLRDLFKIENVTNKKKKIIHIRLGDFFLNEEEQKKYLHNKLIEIDTHSSIVTNRDDLLDLPENQKLLNSKKILHLKTNSYSAFEMIKLFSNYENIESNNSTLAFWGATLGENNLIINDDKLLDLHNLFHGIKK